MRSGLIPGVAVGVMFSEVVSAGELVGSIPLVVLAGDIAFEATDVVEKK